MDDINIFTKNEKCSSYTKNKNIQPGYKNGIWHRNVYYANNEKWERELMKGIELQSQESIRMFGREGKLQTL